MKAYAVPSGEYEGTLESVKETEPGHFDVKLKVPGVGTSTQYLRMSAAKYTALNYDSAPKLMAAPLRRYLELRVPPGGFLRAVLHNDLRDAILRATPTQRSVLAETVLWLWWHAPRESWGSPEAVTRHLEPRRA